ncbi:unnamed protein product [Rotaria sp. Silwood2]|nr:unnamed protein product [Rotaria sp. Silwood2]CAF4458034.1 unnamed protein product [Rotaria sp. Silwood2]
MRLTITLFFTIVCLLITIIRADNVQDVVNDNGSNPALLNNTALTSGSDDNGAPSVPPDQDTSSENADKSSSSQDETSSEDDDSSSSSEDSKDGSKHVDSDPVESKCESEEGDVGGTTTPSQ